MVGFRTFASFERSIRPGTSNFEAVPTALRPPRNWGSGGNGGWRECVVGWMEFLSEFGTERTVVDRAPDLKQQVRAAS